MMVVRPVRHDDLDALMHLARKTGIGFTSLQPEVEKLRARIARSEATLNGEQELAKQGYLFVLEDAKQGKVVGVAGIEAALGLDEPWFNFRLSKFNHVSLELGVKHQHQLLVLSNDHTGCSELCTLFLDPEWRHSRNGQLLSKSRFLFLAAYRERFAKKIVAEMRGFSDEQGRAPFWEGLGRQFCEIDFARADYLTGIGEKGFITELMPRFPIYVQMLPPDAREAIGKVHPQTAPARAMLEVEGLRYEGHVDIFDGGATLEAPIDNLRIVRDSRIVPTARHSDGLHDTGDTDSLKHYLVAKEDRFGAATTFRVILIETVATSECCWLNDTQLNALQLKPGEPVRIVSLY